MALPDAGYRTEHGGICAFRSSRFRLPIQATGPAAPEPSYIPFQFEARERSPVMPDPKFTKPWHGVPREEIPWNPTVNLNACIGCGTCVTGCSRLVYRYDYDEQKAVVADPLNCMVGCTTCANTCPVNAISFPPLASVLDLEHRPEVHHVIEDDLLARREQLEWHDVLPHPERRIRLRVTGIEDAGTRTRLLKLAPLDDTDCLCQFIPGQYLMLEVPGTAWLARAYSIGSAPRPDGTIELQIRRTDEGRVTGWLFENLAVGDTLTAHGPAGNFTLASHPGTPTVFVAGGTGFAPIKAMLEARLASTWASPSNFSGETAKRTTSTTSRRSAPGPGPHRTFMPSWPSRTTTLRWMPPQGSAPSRARSTKQLPDSAMCRNLTSTLPALPR